MIDQVMLAGIRMHILWFNQSSKYSMTAFIMGHYYVFDFLGIGVCVKEIEGKDE